MESSLKTKRVRLAELNHYRDNPRRGDVAAIKRSLEVNGQYRPIVVNEPTMEVLAGNHTLRAARELGWSEIAVSFISCDEEQARRIVLVDNRTNDLAGYDTEALAELLGELDTLDGSGYVQADLDTLLDELAPEPLLEDDAPPPPPDPKTRPGDLYEFGEHRLLCGDARDPKCHARLLGGDQADLLWTDPPYGVSYEGKTKAKLRIENDDAEGLEALLEAAFAAMSGSLRPGAAIYVASPGGRLLLAFGAAFVAAGWDLRQGLVWVKDTLVLGRSDYHYRHEQLLYGFKRGRGRLGRGGAGWAGDDSQSTVLEFARPSASRLHPTMKPPQLVEAMLRNSSKRGDLVLDPFAGSGSTVIAAEHCGRRAALIELDPAYCDVILARYEAAFGGKAKRKRAR